VKLPVDDPAARAKNLELAGEALKALEKMNLSVLTQLELEQHQKAWAIIAYYGKLLKHELRLT
jgi:hypothetical protein